MSQDYAPTPEVEDPEEPIPADPEEVSDEELAGIEADAQYDPQVEGQTVEEDAEVAG